MFPYALNNTARRLALLFLFYFGLRLAFYFLNQDVFEAAPVREILRAFLHGLRFDTAAILTINIPFIALSVFPPQAILAQKKYQRFLKHLFIWLNTLFFFVNLIDVEYFKFVGRRTSNELLTITQDIADQASHLAVDYWYFILITFFLGFILAKLYPKYQPTATDYMPDYDVLRLLGIVFLGLAIIIGIRGGTQYKPLNVSHAFVQEPAVLGNLALNSSFTFIRSLNRASIERKNYFPDQAAAAQNLQFKPGRYKNTTLAPTQDNVVIIILESFASEYIGFENQGQGYTPFFDSLAQQGTFFWHNYANGKRSILALPSILAGIPALMDAPIISSVYESNQLYGLGSILEPAGYTTSFFHGAANGTMGFNAFTKSIGVNKYYGLEEYPADLKDRDYDGLWGIVDEPYLQYVAANISRQKQPFASTIFTLSSHDPYYIPPQYKGRFPKGPLPIHETVGYADFALQKFFAEAPRQPWYENTLFVLTGDHTHKSSQKKYKNQVGMHKVPLLFFHPGKKFPNYNAHKISQHADILPTVVDYLNIPTDKLLPFGQSLLDSAATGKAMYFLEGVATLLHQDYITQLYPNNQFKYYRYRLHGLEKSKSSASRYSE